MKYLWEALLEADREKIPQEMLRFVHSSRGSRYMELSLTCLNQSLISRAGQEKEQIPVEINTYYRFYDIFKNMFPPENIGFPALRESLTNLILHMLAHNDIQRGMTKEEYHKRLLAEEILEGAFGETALEVFLAMSKEHRQILLGGWLSILRAGNALPVFLDMMRGLVEQAIVYHGNDYPDEIFIYTGLKRERSLERRILFLVDTFLDVRYRVEIFYEYHFGIIGIEETMKIDEIAIC